MLQIEIRVLGKFWLTINWLSDVGRLTPPIYTHPSVDITRLTAGWLAGWLLEMGGRSSREWLVDLEDEGVSVYEEERLLNLIEPSL